jgi:hypothetical protein
VTKAELIAAMANLPDDTPIMLEVDDGDEGIAYYSPEDMGECYVELQPEEEGGDGFSHWETTAPEAKTFKIFYIS